MKLFKLLTILSVSFLASCACKGVIGVRHDGPRVAYVMPNSPASQIGIRENDVITNLDEIGCAKVGETVEVRWVRENIPHIASTTLVCSEDLTKW